MTYHVTVAVGLPEFLCCPTRLVEANIPSQRLSRQYTYNVQLDNEGCYTMFYTYDADLRILRIAVLVQTTGWIGLGISPNGQMPGSDVVMGWVDRNGKAFLQVRNMYILQYL